MKALLKKWLTGISFQREYLGVDADSLNDGLNVYLVSPKGKWIEVTQDHIFLGYKPLIFAFATPDNGDLLQNEICLCFKPGAFHPNQNWKGFLIDPESVAQLSLKRINRSIENNKNPIFYEGQMGRHRFISKFHQKLNSLSSLYQKKPLGNVNLPGNLYAQVRIAYSVARKISLVTVSDGELINLFPTDLHGPMDDQFYLGSLRIGGQACDQVKRYSRVVFSEMDASQFATAYAIGKNHMKPLTTEKNFDLSTIRSARFNFPLPVGARKYREMECIDHINIGIHRIFLYKIINQEVLSSETTLSHIHQYYAQWRLSNHLETKYLSR
jgi:hypothetical protein